MAWTEIHKEDGTSAWLNPEETLQRNRARAALSAESNRIILFLIPYLILIWSPINSMSRVLVSIAQDQHASLVDRILAGYFHLIYQFPMHHFFKLLGATSEVFWTNVIVLIGIALYQHFFLAKWFTRILYFTVMIPWFFWQILPSLIG